MTKMIVNLSSIGRVANCKAEINKKAVRKLYWTFEPDGGDNTPMSLLARDDRAGFMGGSTQVSTYTNKDGVSEHKAFRVSCAGKDKFKVSVSLKPDGSGKQTAESFEVWRQIYVSFKYMDAAIMPDLGPLQREYKKHGTVVKKISPPGGEKIKHTEKISEDACMRLKWAVTKAKQEARILLVDKVLSEEWVRSVFTSRSLKVRVRDGAQARPNPYFLWDDAPKFAVGTVRGTGTSLYDITPFLVREDDRTFKLEIPSTAAMYTVLEEAAKKGPLEYSFNVRFGVYPNGFADEAQGFIVIATRLRTGGPRPVAGRVMTMIHELGHGFGLVRPTYQEYNDHTAKPYPAPTKNPKYFDVGSGGHCSTGATISGNNYSGGTCVMFYSSHAGRKPEFCPTCAKLVKAANLAAARMPWPST